MGRTIIKNYIFVSTWSCCVRIYIFATNLLSLFGHSNAWPSCVRCRSPRICFDSTRPILSVDKVNCLCCWLWFWLWSWFWFWFWLWFWSWFWFWISSCATSVGNGKFSKLDSSTNELQYYRLCWICNYESYHCTLSSSLGSIGKLCFTDVGSQGGVLCIHRELLNRNTCFWSDSHDRLSRSLPWRY